MGSYPETPINQSKRLQKTITKYTKQKKGEKWKTTIKIDGKRKPQRLAVKNGNQIVI